MLFEIASAKPLPAIEKGLQDSAAKHKFGIIGVHNLKAKMQEKGVDFASECMIYEVCNPFQAKKVLETNGAVSTALPCRISVYQSGDGYRIATMLPTEMMKAFGGGAELASVAREVEDTIIAMMKESA
jgi:uncharacterized protein (DUF302 family)